MQAYTGTQPCELRNIAADRSAWPLTLTPVQTIDISYSERSTRFLKLLNLNSASVAPPHENLSQIKETMLVPKRVMKFTRPHITLVTFPYTVHITPIPFPYPGQHLTMFES